MPSAGFLPRWRCLYCQANHDPRGCTVARADRLRLYEANKKYRISVLKFLKEKQIQRGTVLRRNGEILIVRRILWHTFFSRFADARGENRVICDGGELSVLDVRGLENVKVFVKDIEGFEAYVEEGEPSITIEGGSWSEGGDDILYPKLGKISREDWVRMPKSDRRKIWKRCRMAVERLHK